MKTLGLQPVRFGEVQATGILEKSQKSQGTGFGEILQKSLDSVNSSMEEARALSEGLINGEHGNIHETMIALEKSSITFRLMTRVQQKAIEAYQDTMRIQL